MARIAIYLGRHLCTAPRPLKEADALAAAGHQVSVHGLWFDPRLVARDEQLRAGRAWTFEPYADCRPGTAARVFRWWRVRGAHRWARTWFRRTGRTRPDVFGYGTRSMLRHAERAAADLTLFHSEGGLFAADVLRRRGRRVGVDFEDWFSEDLPPADRRDRPVAALARLEAAALRHDTYLLATSAAMAAALAARYASRPPAVVYNLFPDAAPMARTPSDRVDPTCVSLHWFSQTLGGGRGLETLMAALPGLSRPWELHLRADDPGDCFDRLARSLPPSMRSRVHLHPTVPNDELAGRIAQHDIGLALDGGDIPSRNLTITNKCFQYLQAGLATVASDTAGHREVLASQPGALSLVPPHDAPALTAVLEAWLEQPAAREQARRLARSAYERLIRQERQQALSASLATQALR